MERNYLLMGAIYCMESARSFLREAVLLYTRGSYPASCVLGTIAAEHLGQCQWLLSKWNAIKNGALMLDCNRLEKDLERDHEGMPRDGFVAVQYGAPTSLSFEILTALDEVPLNTRRLWKGLKKLTRRYTAVSLKNSSICAFAHNTSKPPTLVVVGAVQAR